MTINGTSDFVLTDADIGSPVIAGSYVQIPIWRRARLTTRRWPSTSTGTSWSRGRVSGRVRPGQWGVYSQRYAANGIAEGPQTRVNISTDGSQAYASVAALSADNYMVVWSGNDGAPGEDAEVFYSEQCPVGLVAQYYNNINLSGTPVAAEIAPNIDYNWNCENSPAPGVTGAQWSGSWTGMVKANTSETYTFYLSGDDGVRLYVNGQLLIDQWHDLASPTYSASINMLAGQWYQITVQYYNNTGWENLKLEWSSPSVVREVIPSTQLTHYDQAPTVTQPVSVGATENEPLTISDYVSVPVEDSSFELPSGRYGDYLAGGSQGGWNFTNWTLSSNNTPCSSGIASNGSNYNNPDSVDGYRTAYLQGTAEISQDVNFAEAGDYTVSFLAAYRNGYDGSNPIDVLIDGVKVATITPNTLYYQPYQTASFAVTAGTHAITFKGETNDGTDRTSFIDNVSIRSASGNPLRVSDVDSSSSDPLTVTLSITHGTITLNGADGLTMLAGSGTDDTLMTFQGTADSINAALNGLVFTPEADFRGQAVLTLTASDTGGMGGPQTSVNTLNIDVTGPNCPPVNTLPGNQNVNEHETLIFSTANGNAISVSDPDAGDAVIQVTVATSNGTVRSATPARTVDWTS